MIGASMIVDFYLYYYETPFMAQLQKYPLKYKSIGLINNKSVSS